MTRDNIYYGIPTPYGFIIPRSARPVPQGKTRTGRSGEATPIPFPFPFPTTDDVPQDDVSAAGEAVEPGQDAPITDDTVQKAVEAAAPIADLLGALFGGAETIGRKAGETVGKTADNAAEAIMRDIVGVDGGVRQDGSIALDVLDEGESYCLIADLPGAEKGDIKLNIEDDVVTLIYTVSEESVMEGGNSNEEKEESGEEDGAETKWIVRERKTISGTRSVTLPGIDEERATAKLENGVLTLTAPKKERAGKTVEIG